MSEYDNLAALSISISPVTSPAAAYVQFVRTGKRVFLSGHIAKKRGRLFTGQLGVSLRMEDAEAAARLIAIDLIGSLHAAVADLNKVSRIVKLMVLVNSAPAFAEQHLVTNGASELLKEVFGERGVRARSAFGVAQILFGACVEIELTAELADAA